MFFLPAVDEANSADGSNAVDPGADNNADQELEAQEQVHPREKFIHPPKYKYFESVETEEVGIDHDDMNAVFAMDLDSIAILSDSVSNILKRLHSDPAKEGQPSITISSHFQRRFTPNSSRFYVKTHTGPDGLKLQNKKTGSTTYQAVNLSRFRSIRLGEVMMTNMKFQLELYLISEKSFHGPTNFLTYDLLHPLCAAYNAVMKHPDRYMSSDLTPEQAQTFKSFLEAKNVRFQIAPEKTKNVSLYDKNEPVYLAFNHQHAIIFFMAVEAALLDICEPPADWKFTYTDRVFVPFQLAAGYGKEALKKKAMDIVSSQLFCAQASGIQNIYPLKPSVILQLGEVEKIREFSAEASKLIMEKIKADMHEPPPPGPRDELDFDDDSDTHATMFLFDIALTVTPTQPNVSFLTSHRNGLPIAKELIHKLIPPTRRHNTRGGTSSSGARSVLAEPNNSHHKAELYRNWFVEDRARVRHLGRTSAPVANVPRTEARPDYLEDVYDTGTIPDQTRFTNPTVVFVQRDEQSTEPDDVDAGANEEIQIQTTCGNGCPYNGSKAKAEEAYPRDQHPGNWKHIGSLSLHNDSDSDLSDSESEEENGSIDSKEAGRGQLKMFRKSTVSLPLLIGDKMSPYHTKCQAQVMSIDEALGLAHADISKYDAATRQYMHQKRINLAEAGIYQRLYSADAVANVCGGIGSTNNREDEHEARAIPPAEAEEEVDSLGSTSSIIDGIPGYESSSSQQPESPQAAEEADLPTAIAIENQRRGISQFPQLGSHEVGNCHISNSTLLGTKKLLVDSEPNHWTHFLLKKDKMINGVNMYSGFLRSYWQKKSLPHFYKALPNMVSYAESILAGDVAFDPELLLVANSTKNITAEQIYNNRASSLVETTKGCWNLVEDIASNLDNSDRHGARLELTFTFNKIKDNTTLTWPMLQDPGDTVKWFRIAKTTDLIEFFQMFKNRQVAVLKRVFTDERRMMRAHQLSPPAKTAIVFLVECLVKVLDANGFRGLITEAFWTESILTIPDEAIVPITEFDRDLSGLEYGVDPTFLRCSRSSEFKVQRPPGFAIPSAQWMAAPLSKFVNWPNRYLYHANRINALIKTFYSATQAVEEGKSETVHSQIKAYVHAHRHLCPKFITVNFRDLVQMPRESQQMLLGQMAEEVNAMYNAIWTGRLRTALRRRNHRHSFNDLQIPTKASDFQFLNGDKKDLMRVVGPSSDESPHSLQLTISRSGELMMEAFCYPHKSGDLQWRKCPIQKLFLYVISCLRGLQIETLKSPKPPPTPEGEEPPPPNLFLTNPPELLVEYFVNARTYSPPNGKQAAASIIWSTAPDKLSKHMGVARQLAETMPAIKHQANFVPLSQQYLGDTTAMETIPRRRQPAPKRRKTTQLARTGQSRHNSTPARFTMSLRSETSSNNTVDSSIHQSIYNLTTALQEKLGKRAISKLQKNEFFVYTDRYCEVEEGTLNAPVHEVIAIRALLLSILRYLEKVEKTFTDALSTPSKWMSCFKSTTLHGQHQNSYLYSTDAAISEKIKALKKNYSISQITTAEELINGAPGIQDSEIKSSIWQSATRSLQTQDLQAFFLTATARPQLNLPQLMINQPPNQQQSQDWEEIVQDIALGNLYPHCMQKVIEARTIYMERQEQALKLVEDQPGRLAQATTYKTMWKSPEQPQANINDPSTFPPKYISPKIFLI